MSAFLVQISQLLSRSPGNFAYHIIVLFAIGVNLASLSTVETAVGNPPRRRIFGLLLLFGLRLAVGAFSLLVLTFESLEIWLPAFDSAIAGLSVLILLWLWAFPQTSRLADVATLLLGLLLGTIGVGGVLFWSAISTSTAYQASWLSAGWSAIQIFLLTGGGLLLLIRRPSFWGAGLAMFFLLGAGQVGSLLWIVEGSQFSGLSRLAEIAAYPLLFALREPQREKVESVREGFNPASKPVYFKLRRRYHVEPAVLDSFLAILHLEALEELLPALARVAAHSLVGDVCFLISAPSENGELIVYSGYDLIREEQIMGFSLTAVETPLLADAIQKLAPLRLMGSSTVGDLVAIARSFNLQKSGHLLLVPFEVNGVPFGAIGVLSPYSNRTWSYEDQQYLARIARTAALVISKRLQPVPTPGRTVEFPASAPELQMANDRLEAGFKFPMNLEMIDLTSVLDVAVARLGEPLRDKRIVLRMDLAENLPWIEADREALALLLEQLLEIAGEAAGFEAIVSVNASRELSDSGEPVTALKIATENPIPGKKAEGIGLILGKAIVAAHGGRFWVDQNNHVLIFNLILPSQQLRSNTNNRYSNPG